MSSLKSFSSIRATHATWSEFKEYLAAKEPSVEVLEFDGSPYVILKSGKGPESERDLAEDSVSEISQLCRSVVWDTRTNLPCSVAPFAARRDQKIPLGPDGSALRLEDFVEGVMINIFRTKGDKDVHVTTRSRLDADGTFYSERTFSELFEEALDAKHVSLSDIERVMGRPIDGKGVVASTFMSLVLAHPEHRVVRSVEQANFWAIYRGIVYEDGSVEFFTEDLPATWRPKCYSMTFKAENWGVLKAKFEEIKGSKPWYWQGLVVHTGAGAQRWRFRNVNHDRVRKDLRGTESNPFGRFLRLRANARVQEYLRIYPEDSEAFQGFERDYRVATRTLYTWYCKCHKEHAVTFKALPKSVQPLVFGLHKTYLETLRPSGKTMHFAEVVAWITEHLKTQYGVPNVIRLSREEVQPVAEPLTQSQAELQAQSQVEVDAAAPVADEQTPSITDDADAAEEDTGARSPRLNAGLTESFAVV
jgi:hypothetical protein